MNCLLITDSEQDTHTQKTPRSICAMDSFAQLSKDSLNIQNATFQSFDCTELQCVARSFSLCTFRSVRFTASDFTLSSFYSCNFEDCSFEDCTCITTGFFRSTLLRCRIIDSQYQFARFIACSMRSMKITDTNIHATLFYIDDTSPDAIQFSICNEEEAYFNE